MTKNFDLNTKIDVGALFEAAHVLYVLIDPDFNIIRASKAYLDSLEMKEKDVIGQSIFHIFPYKEEDSEQEGVKKLRSSLERVLKKKSLDVTPIEKYMIRRATPEGEKIDTRYWRFVNSPVLGKNLKVKYIIHRIEDLTAQVNLDKSIVKQLKISKDLNLHLGKMENEIYQRAQEIQTKNEKLEELADKLRKVNTKLKELNGNLEKKEEKIKLTLLASRVGVWSWDFINDRIEIDDIMPLIFGLKTKEEFPKKLNSFLKLLVPEDRNRVGEALQNTLKEVTKYETEYRVIWPDGSTHVIAARGLLYNNKKNVLERMAGVCWDITEIVEAKIRLAELAKELEIQNGNLGRQNERLQEFAYVASHDLQEPLRTVSNFVQLLQKRYKGKLDKDADEFIDFVVSGAERMKALINDLLTYARLDTQQIVLKEIDLEEVLNRTLANLHTAITETRVKITINPLPSVQGDATQLAQLFQNLIENAIRYRKSTQKLTIQIGAIDEGNYWKIFVKDNGIGIHPQFHERIFKIFQRLHSYEKYKGTGIGLALCNRIVERHGGKIGLESDIDKGSTFYFYLPKYYKEKKIWKL